MLGSDSNPSPNRQGASRCATCYATVCHSLYYIYSSFSVNIVVVVDVVVVIVVVVVVEVVGKVVVEEVGKVVVL